MDIGIKKSSDIK